MIVVGVLVIYVVSTAALLSGPAWARRLAIALGVATVPLAWLAPTGAVAMRALVAVAQLLVLARAIDIAGAPCRRSFAWRLWYLTSAFDARECAPCDRAIAKASVIRIGAWAALAVAGGALAFELAPAVGGWSGIELRWIGAAVGFYAGVEAVVGAIAVGHAAVGIAIPPIQRAPILSRTIGEFWSRRWNRPVSRWLRAQCFAPLARRGWPIAGLVLAFAVSAYVHFHFVWAGLGLAMAALMGLFFVVQVPLVLAERAFGVRRWPPVAARAWTVGAMLAVSPLFFEPMLRLVTASA